MPTDKKDIISEVGEGPVLGSHDDPQDNFASPLGDQVKEKSYTRSNVTVTPEQLRTPIPESGFKAPPIDLTKPRVVEAKKEESNLPPPPSVPFNPGLKDVRPKDKRDAAERAVDAILDGYAWLKQASNELLKISDKKLTKLEMQKKISMNLMVPIPFDTNGGMVSMKEFVTIFNEQNGNKIQLDPEDRETLRIVMIDYFADKGIGMTKDNEFIYYGVKELLSLGVALWQGISIKRDMVNSLIEYTAEMRAKRTAPAAAVPPQYQSPPPPPTTSNVTIVPDSPPPNNNTGNGRNGDAIVDIDHMEIHNDNNQGKEVPLAMQGADAALVIVGAQQQGPIVTKARGGRPTKEEAAKKKEDRINNKDQVSKK